MAQNVLWARVVLRHSPPPSNRKTKLMLWTVAVILTILWALGLVTAHTMGGFIHILVVLAVVAVIVRLVQGRRLL